MKPVVKIGVGGPVGSGKTALVERLVPMLLDAGYYPGVIANDIFTREDERILRRALAGILDERRILGVETGGCPHTAVREDPTVNLAAIESLLDDFPDTDVVLIESGGDNLTLTFSPLLADYSIYVLDTAAGDKMPRKQGPGMIQADLLVINKIDLARYVGADLSVMDRDARAVRRGPIRYTNCRGDQGVDRVVDWLAGAIAAGTGSSRIAQDTYA
jgi:urease accessory protein